MKKHIEVEAFKRKLIDEKSFFPAIVARALEEMPEADVVEVKHGEWLYSRVHNILHCSECGEIPDCFEPPYCPNCGAKMDGGKKE